MKSSLKNLTLQLLALLACGLSSIAIGATPEDELRGVMKIRFNNCGCPDHQATGPEISYLLLDSNTQEVTELEIDEEQAKNFKVDKPVKLRGNFKDKKSEMHLKRKDKAFKPSKITYEPAAAEQGASEPAADGEAAADEPEVANAATTQDLQCLIIHANTSDKTANATKIQDMEDILFNDAANMSDAVLAASYGHYRLTHGNVMSVTVELPGTTASSTTAGQMENLMVNALPAAFTALGESFNAGDYDRYLICLPEGTTDISTAYGYYGGSPRRTIYSYSWTGTTFDGILHELGHNFGFRHSGTGTNVYGDRTCVMGYSHLNRGNVTATYGAVKKLQNGWFAPFSNTETTISGDATFDLYPISQDPDATPGMRLVKVSDSDHYISYRRQFNPYAWLRYGSDANKVYVHRNSSFSSETWRESGLTSGSYTAGTTQVIFERYGPNNEYATVSFDMDDGNAKPVADAQSINATINTPQSIILSGSDGNGDTLAYTKVTDPTNGVLSGTAPNLTYTPNNNYLGSDSFVFKVNDGQISSFATVSITVNEVNTPPVANNQSVSVYFETPEPITLTASDANGHSLSYSVVAGPSSGALSGTPPNLTYTPNNTFSGNDSFTFKANDGQADSNTATVSITVSATPNTAPSVEAGPNQAILLQSVTNTPGLYYGTVAGNIDESTANPESQLLVNPSTETENSIASNTTEIYTGNIYDADGQISFTEHIDDKARIWIDDVLVLSNDSWNTRTSTANLDLAPGWHTFEIRISNGTGGAGPVDGEIGIGYDPNGGTAWQTLTDPGDGSFLRVNQSSSSAVATLNATSVTDPEHSPSYAWSDTGTGTGTGLVTFSDANALSPTVTFTEVGTYILRLTADDGYTQSFDEVTITVTLASNDPPVTDAGPDQTVYMTGASWSAGITYDPITDDADSGISSDKVYTHALDFGSDATRALINGVQFQAGGTTFGDKAGTSATVGTGTTTIPSPHVGNTNAAPYLNGASPCGMEDLVKDMNYNDGTAVITLTGLTPGVHYKFKLYHRVWSGTRIQNIGFDTDGVGSDITGAEYTGTFDQDDATVPDPGFATATQVYALTLDYSLPSGVTSLNVYIDNVSGGTYHLYGLTNEVDTSTGASATLDGTVTDGEQTPTGSWSVVGGNASAVSFADANAIDTTAIFTEAGTYTLQLTGDDGYETSTDTVTIIVNPPLPTIYATWTSGTFSNSFDIIGIADNPDGDSSSNFMEFAFGTDPTSQDGGSLAINGSSNGNPMAAEGAGAAMELYFVRRDDHGTSGSVSYTVQFSDDLSTFTDSLTSPTFVADSSEDSAYEVVKVPFPLGAKFGRIQIEAAP